MDTCVKQLLFNINGVNFLFVDQQNQGSLSHTRCTIPVQHAQLQARCTTSSQDKLSHSICTISDIATQLHSSYTTLVRQHHTELQQQQPKSKAEKDRVVTSKTMHPNTWKQSDMVGVNHLCMVQGNEESTSSFFVLFLFCVFMVIGLTMEHCPLFCRK